MPSARFPDLASIDAALAAPEFLVFKHSTTCPVSAKAFAVYQAFCAAWPEVPTAWIDVAADRAWSQHVAAVTGVRHESPQALLVRKGRVVWHSSHSAITRAALADAVSAGR